MDELTLFFTIFPLHHRKGIKLTSQNEYMQNIDILLSDNIDTSVIYIQVTRKFNNGLGNKYMNVR